MSRPTLVGLNCSEFWSPPPWIQTLIWILIPLCVCIFRIILPDSDQSLPYVCMTKNWFAVFVDIICWDNLKSASRISWTKFGFNNTPVVPPPHSWNHWLRTHQIPGVLAGVELAEHDFMSYRWLGSPTLPTSSVLWSAAKHWDISHSLYQPWFATFHVLLEMATLKYKILWN